MSWKKKKVACKIVGIEGFGGVYECELVMSVSWSSLKQANLSLSDGEHDM